MSSTSAKIVLAVGLTALFTAVILIAAFVGFLYFRPASDVVTVPGQPSGRETSSRREKGPVSVSADEITEIRLQRSSMSSTTPPKPAAFFGNINVQNFVSKDTQWNFASDGTAVKVVSEERTQNGANTSPGPTKYVVPISREQFLRLANVLVENDFANEPDSRKTATLPASVTVAVTYSKGVKTIKASNIGEDTPEMSAIIRAIDDLDAKIDWAAGKQ